MKRSKKVSPSRVVLLVITVLLLGMFMCSIPNLFVILVLSITAISLAIIALAVYRAMLVPNVSGKEYTEYLRKGSDRMRKVLNEQ
ncbi:uncharacterized protein NEMAJ01_1437 [Nematocida major]|uniref:uncharacterized protein n=1 Tax=Nematocida major TaxID=1912982 RepID=UPI0020084565|nr:uncharacterized protein NEMAJ01_1437 [Nematocida major]KAH9386541.1 hypothetical protein NEMAJ01_1437 [Nematocida major]